MTNIRTRDNFETRRESHWDEDCVAGTHGSALSAASLDPDPARARLVVACLCARGRKRFTSVLAALREDELGRAEPALPRTRERLGSLLLTPELGGHGRPAAVERWSAQERPGDEVESASPRRGHEARDEVARELHG